MILNIVTAIAVVELLIIGALFEAYRRKAQEIKYFKPIEISRKEKI